ncbi:MAG: helix-turn-helix domain-containing protein [Pseudomonadota bacterium]
MTDIAPRTGNRHDGYDCNAGCPVEAALELIGQKWKGIALWHLSRGTLRFTELKRAAGTVTQRMLTKQLRELEADGLIHREVYPEVPPRVEYSLTDRGRTLVPILRALRDWGEAEAIPILTARAVATEAEPAA